MQAFNKYNYDYIRVSHRCKSVQFEKFDIIIIEYFCEVIYLVGEIKLNSFNFMT